MLLDRKYCDANNNNTRPSYRPQKNSPWLEKLLKRGDFDKHREKKITHIANNRKKWKVVLVYRILQVKC